MHTRRAVMKGCNFFCLAVYIVSHKRLSNAGSICTDLSIHIRSVLTSRQTNKDVVQ